MGPGRDPGPTLSHARRSHSHDHPRRNWRTRSDPPRRREPAQAATRRLPVRASVLRRLRGDARRAARLRRLPACSGADSSAARSSPGSTTTCARLPTRASSTGLRRVALILLVQVPIMLGLALFFALALDSGRARGSGALRLLIFLPYAVPGVVATLMWGYLYGRDFGPIGQAFRAVGLQAPELLLRTEHARLDHEHRHVVVRRLQHDDHVLGPPSRSPTSSTKLPRSTARASSEWPGASRSP